MPTQREKLEAELGKLAAAEQAALEPITTAQQMMPALHKAHAQAVKARRDCEKQLMVAIQAERAATKAAASATPAQSATSTQSPPPPMTVTPPEPPASATPPASTPPEPAAAATATT